MNKKLSLELIKKFAELDKKLQEIDKLSIGIRVDINELFWNRKESRKKKGLIPD